MLRSIVPKCLAGAVLALGLGVSDASAQATRTWVSGVGDDANPCSRTAPCKTFAGAISKTAAGGEIDVLDPGGWGALTITKSITIDGGPNAGGILNPGTNGIVISAAATDTVIIRNLTIQGAGTGLAGIKVLSVGALHVENCVITSQAQKGIDLQNNLSPAGVTRLFVLNTVIRENKDPANGGGIFIKPAASNSVQAQLDRVDIQRNTFGIRAEDNSTVSARDSFFSGNSTHGVVAVSTAANVVINLQSCNISQNTSSGLRSVSGGATIRFSNSMIDNNALGLESVTVSGPGKLISFTNNSIGGNTTDGNPTGTIALK